MNQPPVKSNTANKLRYNSSCDTRNDSNINLQAGNNSEISNIYQQQTLSHIEETSDISYTNTAAFTAYQQKNYKNSNLPPATARLRQINHSPVSEYLSI